MQSDVCCVCACVSFSLQSVSTNVTQNAAPLQAYGLIFDLIKQALCFGCTGEYNVKKKNC